MSGCKCERDPTLLELADKLEQQAAKSVRGVAMGVLGYSSRDRTCQEAWAGLQIAQRFRAIAMEAAKPTRREAGSARQSDSAGPQDIAQSQGETP